jgi:hypothetical protein
MSAEEKTDNESARRELELEARAMMGLRLA